jgi:hypothetical protein
MSTTLDDALKRLTAMVGCDRHQEIDLVSQICLDSNLRDDSNLSDDLFEELMYKLGVDTTDAWELKEQGYFRLEQGVLDNMSKIVEIPLRKQEVEEKRIEDLKPLHYVATPISTARLLDSMFPNVRQFPDGRKTLARIWAGDKTLHTEVSQNFLSDQANNGAMDRLMEERLFEEINSHDTHKYEQSLEFAKTPEEKAKANDDYFYQAGKVCEEFTMLRSVDERVAEDVHSHNQKKYLEYIEFAKSPEENAEVYLDYWMGCYTIRRASGDPNDIYADRGGARGRLASDERQLLMRFKAGDPTLHVEIQKNRFSNRPINRVSRVFLETMAETIAQDDKKLLVAKYKRAIGY